MKNPKNPTRNQKNRLIGMKLNPTNWLVIKDNSIEFEIIHRNSKKIRVIKAS